MLANILCNFSLKFSFYVAKLPLNSSNHRGYVILHDKMEMKCVYPSYINDVYSCSMRVFDSSLKQSVKAFK